MARLVIKTEGFGNRILELHLGNNRVGRDDDCEFVIDHPTVSTLHCELHLTADGIYVHDCDSTNGTFVSDEPVMEAWLDPGQTLKLGDVELLVESTTATIAIPKIERAAAKAPAAVLDDGSLPCPRHLGQRATFKCTSCHEVMCGDCVRMMRLTGGKPLFLCCKCHQKCERIASDPVKEKKGVLGLFQETVRLVFGRGKSKK